MSESVKSVQIHTKFFSEALIRCRVYLLKHFSTTNFNFKIVFTTNLFSINPGVSARICSDLYRSDSQGVLNIGTDQLKGTKNGISKSNLRVWQTGTEASVETFIKIQRENSRRNCGNWKEACMVRRNFLDFALASYFHAWFTPY